MEYISLGSSCSVAYQLQNHNVRNCAYPFDWIRINRFSYINELINNNFEGFDDIKFVRNDVNNSFPLLNDDFEHNNIKTCICKNKYATFYHDFTDCENIDGQYTKYIRRIDRLYSIIKSDKYIHFIRDELKPNNICIDDINNFDIIVKNINPDIKYKLTIIVHNPNNKYYPILDYNNNNICIINDCNKFGNWTRENVEWYKLI